MEKELLTIDIFRQHLNRCFIVSGVGEPVEMELVEVTDTTVKYGSNNALKRIPFNLLFKAPKGCYYPQATYNIELDSVGEVPIFLVPVGPERKDDPDSSMLFQAVYN